MSKSDLSLLCLSLRKRISYKMQRNRISTSMYLKKLLKDKRTHNNNCYLSNTLNAHNRRNFVAFYQLKPHYEIPCKQTANKTSIVRKMYTRQAMKGSVPDRHNTMRMLECPTNPRGAPILRRQSIDIHHRRASFEDQNEWYERYLDENEGLDSPKLTYKPKYNK